LTTDHERYRNANYSGGFRGSSKRFRVVLTPRIGDRAASLYVKGWRTLWWEAALIVAGAIPAAVGVAISVPPVWIAGIVIWCGVFVVGGVAITEFRRSRKAASLAIGIDLRRGEPPLRKEKYLVWCERKGIQPFAAKDSSRTNIQS